MKQLIKALVIAILLCQFQVEQSRASIQLDRIQLPPGFKISLFNGSVPGARSLALGAKGTLFVGTREESGKVYAIKDGKVFVIAQGLLMPNGVAFRDGALYVAEVSRVLRFPGIEAKLATPPKPEIVLSGLPSEQHHGWKFISFGPDGYLYLQIGAPCNNCLKDDPRYAAILRVKLNGPEAKPEVFASGVRNTVGFDWHPRTHELWFTDNGRDLLGDDVPSDELNHAPKSGMHFGFPFCHEGRIADPEFGKRRKCDEFIPPVVNLGAHVAALGMRFYTGKQFPEKYRGKIFIAEHGSWNRSSKVGYQIVVAPPGKGPVEVFAHGWLQGETAWGRPVDVLTAPDGALLVSDDLAGAIYRIEYDKR